MSPRSSPYGSRVITKTLSSAPCSRPSCILAWTSPREGRPKPQHKPFFCRCDPVQAACRPEAAELHLKPLPNEICKIRSPGCRSSLEASDCKPVVLLPASEVLRISQSSRSRTRLKTRRCSPSRAGFGLTSNSAAMHSLPSSYQIPDTTPARPAAKGRSDLAIREVEVLLHAFYHRTATCNQRRSPGGLRVSFASRTCMDAEVIDALG